MKNYYNHIFRILYLILFTYSCSNESYIEGEGFVETSSSNPTNSTGSVTIFSQGSNIGFCSGGLNITVDGISKGTLYENSINGAPNCGENSRTAVTITLSEGTHKFVLKGSGTLCPSYSFNVTIEKGKCFRQPVG